MWLSEAFWSQNRTRNQSKPHSQPAQKPYMETVETVTRSVLGQRYVSPWGSQENLLFSNRMRNRPRSVTVLGILTSLNIIFAMHRSQNRVCHSQHRLSKCYLRRFKPSCLSSPISCSRHHGCSWLDRPEAHLTGWKCLCLHLPFFSPLSILLLLASPIVICQ